MKLEFITYTLYIRKNEEKKENYKQKALCVCEREREISRYDKEGIEEKKLHKLITSHVGYLTSTC